MTKLSIPLVITASFLFTAACENTEKQENKEVEREAKDVEKAGENLQQKEQEVQEAKAELREKKVELAVEMQQQLDDLEKRYRELDEKAMAATKSLDTTTGVGAEIQQAHMLAKAKLEAARNATTPEETQRALEDAKDAIDKLDKKLGEKDEV